MDIVVSFSGGKDSTALILYLRERGLEHDTVFCDTLWEHPKTLKYIDYINQTLLDGNLITLKSENYKYGMEDLIIKKKRVPSVRARFCTGALKIDPMIEWLKDKEYEMVLNGIRAEESRARAKMVISEWSNDFDCWIGRPLFRWSAEDVFNIHKKHNIKPNPLYLEGAYRVGCFPCVMISIGKLENLAQEYPEIWERMELLEDYNGRSFFPPKYIPDRYTTGFDEKSKSCFPWVSDVKDYILNKRKRRKNFDQLDIFPTKCTSIYNLCE